MEENEMLQIARMVQDNNLPTREMQLPIDSDQHDGRFIHPDDVRGHDVDTINTGLKGNERKHPDPIVMVTTDAALRMVPSVRNSHHLLARFLPNMSKLGFPTTS
jgi:hypothetical protein